VIEKRIEEVKVNKELHSAVDIGVTRALFDISTFIKKASHIIRPGGTLILNKGPKVHEETAKIGDVSYTLLTVDLPLSDIKRYIVRVTL
jgi:16S rRNA G527 N7-methylase RsmG